MHDRFGPLCQDEARLQKSADTVQRTKQMLSVSKKEIDDMKTMVRYSHDTVAKTRKLLADQQSKAWSSQLVSGWLR